MKTKFADITIKKDDVYLKVRKHSSYIGGKDVYNVSAESYDRISAAEEDSIMLDELWERVLPSLSSVLQRYMSGPGKAEKGEGSVTYHLTLPLSFRRSTNIPVLTSACTEYMTNAMLVEWLKTANADDDAKRMAETAAGNIIEIKDILARRDMPMRFMTSEEPIDKVIITVD